MKNGGPAFPCDEWQYDKFSRRMEMVRVGGMSVLDYFAGKTRASNVCARCSEELKGQCGSADRAMCCYSEAEAMLAERAKRAEEDGGKS